MQHYFNIEQTAFEGPVAKFTEARHSEYRDHVEFNRRLEGLPGGCPLRSTRGTGSSGQCSGAI
eukprot:9042813-Lingulodinium_polyedra.AAC.1